MNSVIIICDYKNMLHQDGLMMHNQAALMWITSDSPNSLHPKSLQGFATPPHLWPNIELAEDPGHQHHISVFWPHLTEQFFSFFNEKPKININK